MVNRMLSSTVNSTHIQQLSVRNSKSSAKQDNNLPAEDQEMDPTEGDDTSFEKPSNEDVMKTNDKCFPKVARGGQKRKVVSQRSCLTTRLQN
ncbi:lens epithelium-derived growth factor-like [Struthio camelus]|uniref:lens epithelium-derived growth factor-like n=1 Tax=Struthio camelus TaxID=8801 RepID=UPI003603F041